MLIFQTSKSTTKESRENLPIMTCIDKHISDINTLKENKFNIKYLKKTRKKFIKKKDSSSSALISYIIIVNVSKRNSSILITDRTGKKKSFYTSNNLGFTKTQKHTMIAMLRKMVYNYKYLNNKNSIVIFKGLRRYHKLIIAKLKKKLNVKAIIYNKSLPHNGCRPKKIRRV